MLRLAIASSTGFFAGCLVLFVAGFLAAPEASAAPYQQVVDNQTSGRFKVTTSWGASSYSSQRYGSNYRFARPGAGIRGGAAYKIRTPSTGFYTVCGRWPANRGYNSFTAIRITTTGGNKIRRVDQRKNGGRWVRIGTYKMGRGDAYRLAVLRSSYRPGYVVADAFKIVRSPNSRGVGCTTSSTPTRATPTSAEKGRKVVREGRKYLGVRYRYGSCTSTLMSCTCLTKKAYRAVGINLSLMEIDQWRKGRRVSTPQAGDLLFYDEDGRGGKPITHVGVYAGKSRSGTPMILHASSYWGKVVVKPMRWPGDGYIGARRLV